MPAAPDAVAAAVVRRYVTDPAERADVLAMLGLDSLDVAAVGEAA